MDTPAPPTAPQRKRRPGSPLGLGSRGALCVLAACLGAGVTSVPLVARPSQAHSAGIKWVWTGGVTARSAVVKARVAVPDALVRLAVTRAQEATGKAVAHEARADADGIAAFALQRLDPATRYEYRVEVEGAAPMTGAFRTFGEGAWSFRIAFSACAETGSARPVFDAIKDARPDLFIHTGDIHYEDITTNAPERFRPAFDSVMSSPTQSRLYRDVPIAYTWDDHDFGGNGSDASSAAKPAALAVYGQFVPHYPLTDDGRTGIHQAFTIGRVRVIMTDSRSQRTSTRGAPSGRTMLGAAQLQWLEDELSAAADAPLIIWVNTVPWIGKAGFLSDHWGAYAQERQIIANHIDRLGVTRRLLMLSGDAHMVAIDDGTHSNYATGPGRGARGFVVMHAAPLDRKTSEKGGPYSQGVSRQRGQFGLLQVTDDGSALRVELSGHDRQGRPIAGQRLLLACADAQCAPLP